MLIIYKIYDLVVRMIGCRFFLILNQFYNLGKIKFQEFIFDKVGFNFLFRKMNIYQALYYIFFKSKKK